MQPGDLPAFPKFPVANQVSSPEPPRQLGRGAKLTLALAGVGALVLLAIGVVAIALPQPPANPKPPPALDAKSTGIPAYAVNEPRTVPADRAEVMEDEPLVGVSFGGKHRAYLMRALSGRGPMVHIVNDVLAGVPVTVAECDRSGCLKAFTADQRGTPLRVAFGGYRHGRMYLRVGDNVYEHATLVPALPHLPPFPYVELPVERTTWKEWRTAHPDTDVYVGGVKPTLVPNP